MALIECDRCIGRMTILTTDQHQVGLKHLLLNFVVNLKVNTFVVEEFEVAADNRCNFYTVRFEEDEISQTDLFFDRYVYSEYSDDAKAIFTLLAVLAKKGSRIITRARDEGSAEALPGERMSIGGTTDNKLRLYYMRVTDSIFVLLGGGLAHREKGGSPSIALREAHKFIQRIDDARNLEYTIGLKKLNPVSGGTITI